MKNNLTFNASNIKGRLRASISKKISDAGIKFPLTLSNKLGSVCIREYNTGRLYDITRIDKIIFNPKNPTMPKFVLKVMDAMGDRDEYTIFMDDNDFDVETLKSLHRLVYFTVENNPENFSFEDYENNLKKIVNGTIVV